MYKIEITFNIPGAKAVALELLGKIVENIMNLLSTAGLEVTGGIVHEMKEE